MEDYGADRGFSSIENGAESVEGTFAEDGRVVEPHVLVQALDLIHVRLIQLKGEQVQIGLDPIRVLRLGDDGAAALDPPTKNHLTLRLAYKAEFKK